MLTSNTLFFSKRSLGTYHSSAFIDHHEYLIYMTIIIPYKIYKTKDLESYFVSLFFPLSACVRDWYFSKKCKKKAIFQVQIGVWEFIRTWPFIRIFTVNQWAHGH